MSKLISRMVAAIQAATATKTSGYDTVATVKRVEGNTAWVHIPGGVDETPAKMTINAKAGDSVQVRIGNGKAFLVGNATSPPTDDTKAIVAQKSADEAAIAALKARQRAHDAQMAAEKNAINMANAVVEINSDIADLQAQIDGNVTSWFYTVDPAMNLPPVTVDPDNPESTGWDTDDKKQNHVGDLYYNTDTGHVWRFVYQNGAYQWVAVQDSDVTRALELASEAKDTADGKRRVFITQPVPPYDEGDLWFVGANSDILTCTTAKVEGQLYEAADWTKLNKYTDNTLANAAYNLASSASTRAGNAITAANGKNTIYHQAAKPTGGTYKAGDTWFDTSNGYRMYTYSETSRDWVAEQFGSAAIEDLSITNAKIANGTIQSAKIQSLDVGKLTGGYIDAAHIRASDFNVGDFENDGTYTTGEVATVTTHTRQTTYATAVGYVGISNDSWGSVTAFDGSAGDMVLIPFQITDRDNSQASMLCRVRSYSGNTLYADNLALMMDASASKYVTAISGYAGVCVHAASDVSNFANMNSDGLHVYKSRVMRASFKEDQATLGGDDRGNPRAIVKYSQDGSAFGIQDSHRVVIAKATDEDGVRNDATLSSREITTFSSSKPMAFINATHKVSGSTKTSQAGLYAWRGLGIVPTYVILQEGNGSGDDPLSGDAARGLYIRIPKLMINGNDWTELWGDYNDIAAEVSSLNTEMSDIALSIANISNKFARTPHSFTIASIAAGGTSGEKTVSFEKSGYYPIGIVGWKSAAGKVMFPRLEITQASSGSVTVTYNAHNASGTASGNLSATVDILWVKTS